MKWTKLLLYFYLTKRNMYLKTSYTFISRLLPLKLSADRKTLRLKGRHELYMSFSLC